MQVKIIKTSSNASLCSVYETPTSDWTIYPVTYQGKQYVIDVLYYKALISSKTVVAFFIYEYASTEIPIRGHRRKNIFNTEVETFTLDDGSIIDALNIADNKFIELAPQIIRFAFHLYEVECTRSQQTETKVDTCLAWDGVVEATTDASKKEPLDYDKQLTDEQYDTEEYQIGFANGVCDVLGLMQRKKALGWSLEEIIEETFRQHNDIFQIKDLK